MDYIHCLKDKLEELYLNYNKREYVNPDPLLFLYDYKDKEDIEIAGLIASSLAYGNVKQIIKSVGKVLTVMGPSPYDFIKTTKYHELIKHYSGFKHRFTTDTQLADMLIGIQNIIINQHSLGNAFLKYFKSAGENIIDALGLFVKDLKGGDENKKSSLLPVVHKNSASKRLFLYLRWMIRKDDVDLGLWQDIPTSKLIIPLDTHMYSISSHLGMTHRKSADLKTAKEITSGFAYINPEDPVKYDFVITRMGIRDDFDVELFLNECRVLFEKSKAEKN
jgi:uncharacterized protein (TIGR02757 family)